MSDCRLVTTIERSLGIVMCALMLAGCGSSLTSDGADDAAHSTVGPDRTPPVDASSADGGPMTGNGGMSGTATGGTGGGDAGDQTDRDARGGGAGTGAGGSGSLGTGGSGSLGAGGSAGTGVGGSGSLGAGGSASLGTGGSAGTGAGGSGSLGTGGSAGTGVGGSGSLGTGGASGSLCAPGAQRCNGVAAEFCGPDRTWNHLQTCQYACNNGFCSGVCAPGTMTCDFQNVTPETCNALGLWDFGRPCPFQCAGGQCVGECTVGATRCTGSVQQVCVSSTTAPFEGHWNSGFACPFVCLSGTCSGSCVPGSTRCSAVSTAQTCNSLGQWDTATTTCPFGCAGTSCVSGVPAACAAQTTRSVAFTDDFESYGFGALRDVSGNAWLPTNGSMDVTTDPFLGLGSGQVMVNLSNEPYTGGGSYRPLGRAADAPLPARLSLSIDNGTWAFPTTDYGIHFSLARVTSAFTLAEVLAVDVFNRSVVAILPSAAPFSISVPITSVLDYDTSALTTFRVEIDFCQQTLTLYSKRPAAAEVLAGRVSIPAGVLPFDAFFMRTNDFFGTYIDNVSVAIDE